MTNTKIPGELTVSVQDDMFVCTDGAGCFTRPATNDEKLLWAEIVRLRTEHEADLDRMERAAQAIEQYQTWHAGGRANIESQGDVLRICDGEHEKFAPCQFVEYRRVSGDSRLAPEPTAQPEIVGWMVGDPGGCPAMYNLHERERAFDAAKRWDRPITALVVDPRAPDFPTAPGDRAPIRTALEFIRDGLIPQGMSAKLFAERVLAQCSEKSVCEPGPIQPGAQDYTVQCRCGWMGRVSTLKSLPGFKMGCPTCSAEFVPIDRMTFPVRT